VAVNVRVPADDKRVRRRQQRVAANPALRSDLPHDWARDLIPVVLLAKLPFVAETTAGSPVRDMEWLGAVARAGGSGLIFGSGGTGTVAHLAREFFGLRSGIPTQHVPYRCETPALTDTLGGQLSVMFSRLASASGQIQNGTMRALGLTTGSRPRHRAVRGSSRR